jgi:hypothetical protein
MDSESIGGVAGGWKSGRRLDARSIYRLPGTCTYTRSYPANWSKKWREKTGMYIHMFLSRQLVKNMARENGHVHTHVPIPPTGQKYGEKKRA